VADKLLAGSMEQGAGSRETIARGPKRDSRFEVRRSKFNNMPSVRFVSLTELSRLCIFFVETRGLSMHVRVQKWGNSLAVRIPKPLAEDAEVKEGTVLNLAVSQGKVVATPVHKKKFSLKQLLSKVHRKNLHAEIESGSPVGRESW
jgi:antitoxin MazE